MLANSTRFDCRLKHNRTIF